MIQDSHDCCNLQARTYYLVTFLRHILILRFAHAWPACPGCEPVSSHLQPIRGRAEAEAGPITRGILGGWVGEREEEASLIRHSVLKNLNTLPRNKDKGLGYEMKVLLLSRVSQYKERWAAFLFSLSPSSDSGQSMSKCWAESRGGWQLANLKLPSPPQAAATSCCLVSANQRRVWAAISQSEAEARTAAPFPGMFPPLRGSFSREQDPDQDGHD